VLLQFSDLLPALTKLINHTNALVITQTLQALTNLTVASETREYLSSTSNLSKLRQLLTTTQSAANKLHVSWLVACLSVSGIHASQCTAVFVHGRTC
jgi:hypothetical protein